MNPGRAIGESTLPSCCPSEQIVSAGGLQASSSFSLPTVAVSFLAPFFSPRKAMSLFAQSHMAFAIALAAAKSGASFLARVALGAIGAGCQAGRG